MATQGFTDSWRSSSRAACLRGLYALKHRTEAAIRTLSGPSEPPPLGPAPLVPAIRARREGRLRDALEAYGRAAECEETRSTALCDAATLLEQIDSVDALLGDFDGAYGLADDAARPRTILADARKAFSGTTSSELFSDALRADRSCAPAHAGLGREALRRGDAAEAVACFRMSASLDGRPETLCRCGEALEALGQYGEAGRFYRDARAAGANSHAVQRRIGDCQLRDEGEPLAGAHSYDHFLDAREGYLASGPGPFVEGTETTYRDFNVVRVQGWFAIPQSAGPLDVTRVLGNVRIPRTSFLRTWRGVVPWLKPRAIARHLVPARVRRMIRRRVRTPGNHILSGATLEAALRQIDMENR